MLSADQVHVFLAVIDEGGFSAAARALRRQQSAVSYAISNLENQLGVLLFDRSGTRALLTAAGEALVADARKATAILSAMLDRGAAMARGIEPEISIAIDTFCPLPRIADAMADFAREFRVVKVQVHLELRHQVLKLVTGGACQLAVLIHPVGLRNDLERYPMAGPMGLRPYVGAGHPLARAGAHLESANIDEHIQFTLADRDGVSTGQELGTFSSRTWACSDLRMMLALIRAGIGWGFLPDELAAPALSLGEIVQLHLAASPDDGVGAGTMMVVRHTDAVLGPAATWLLRRLLEPPQA